MNPFKISSEHVDEMISNVFNHDCPLKKGERFVKTVSEPKDNHQIGDKGTILGGHLIPEELLEKSFGKGHPPMYLYLVSFDNDSKSTHCLISSLKISKSAD